MAIDKNEILHRSERLPGIVRNEIYEYKDIVYTEQYDDETNEMIHGNVTMFDGLRVCSVYKDGSINISQFPNIAVNRKWLMTLIEDLQRMDEFLSVVVKNYH